MRSSGPGSVKSTNTRGTNWALGPRPSIPAMAAPAAKRVGGSREAGREEPDEGAVAGGATATAAAPPFERGTAAPRFAARATFGSTTTAATKASAAATAAQSTSRTSRRPSSPSASRTVSVPRKSTSLGRISTWIVRASSPGDASRTRVPYAFTCSRNAARSGQPAGASMVRRRGRPDALSVVWAATARTQSRPARQAREGAPARIGRDHSWQTPALRTPLLPTLTSYTGRATSSARSWTSVSASTGFTRCSLKPASSLRRLSWSWP